MLRCPPKEHTEKFRALWGNEPPAPAGAVAGLMAGGGEGGGGARGLTAEL